MATQAKTEVVDQTNDCPEWHADRGHHETYVVEEYGQTTIKHLCEIRAMEELEASEGF